ncbi:MAG: ion transporter [Alphaproteobacteria bacterium]|nr:ion transporter [Alphaproteobacteria bacterium]
MKKRDINEERRNARRVVESNNFDYLIMFVICMDAVALGMLTIGFYDAEFIKTMFLLDRLCMAIFIVEMLLKMYAYGPQFFKSNWNIFDLVIITVSSIPIASYLIILRTFRLFRLLKYISHFNRMKNIINIMITILPHFAAMSVILAVFVYVFGVIGVALFGAQIPAFGDLWSSIFALLQAFTLDGWASTIARPVMRIYPYAWVFFLCFVMISFLLITSFLLSMISLMVKKEFKVRSNL